MVKELVLAVVVYLTMGYINEFVAQNQVYHSIHQPPMFDRGHNLLPLYSKRYPDYLLAVILLYFLVRWAIPYPHTLINYLWIISLLFIGRVIILSVTQFPPALPGCSTIQPGEKFNFNIFRKNWNTCIDYMYSGHTIHSVLVALFTLHLSNSPIEKISIVFLTLIELVFIIGSRIHYTGDVLVATVVSVLAFYAWPGIDKLLEHMMNGGIYGKLLRNVEIPSF